MSPLYFYHPMCLLGQDHVLYCVIVCLYIDCIFMVMETLDTKLVEMHVYST